MISREEMARLLKTGGKEGLNCIAELDQAALEQVGAAGSLPLSGIPVLVKDNIDVRGLHTTAGSLALEDNIAGADAPIIRNLRRSGAVPIGKTNMTEFANYVTKGMPGGYSSRGGQVIHAVDPKLSASGSSSGSAVAVAAGIVDVQRDLRPEAAGRRSFRRRHHSDRENTGQCRTDGPELFRCAEAVFGHAG